jgi:hypothetical protein
MPYKLKGKCVVRSDTGEVVKCHPNRAAALRHLRALKVNVHAMTAIEAVEKHKPKLTTVKDVEIVKTGIEYPLSSGPTTFTAEDLADALASQQDPAIPTPRVWLGHPDDTRIHGDRTLGPASGEPCVGKVTNMRLTQGGHTLRGDLIGVPVWLSNILGSAYPARSIEGKINFKTPTGKKWRLVISGLALLGVVWPGVGTLEDIASLYTEEGPEGIEIKEAQLAANLVNAQVNIEDVRRAFYEYVKGDEEKSWWWIRTMMIDPHEIVVDADNGDLYKLTYKTAKDKVEFGKPKKVKIKYVNATQGGIVPERLFEERPIAAQFDSRAESRPADLGGELEVTIPRARTVHIDVKKGVSL